MSLRDRIYWINAKYPGTCIECKTQIYEGDRIAYDSVTRKIYCEECGEDMLG